MFNPPGGPPGPPIQWGDELTNETVEPGFGYIGTGAIPENDQYFYHPDHLGSTAYVTNVTGAVCQFFVYLPYGEALIDKHSSPWKVPYTFSAKEQDAETKLTYFEARYYDAKYTTFLTIDPLWQKYPGISAYAYCANNPIRFIDPTGEDWNDFVTAFKGAYNQHLKDIGNAIIHPIKTVEKAISAKKQELSKMTVGDAALSVLTLPLDMMSGGAVSSTLDLGKAAVQDINGGDGSATGSVLGQQAADATVVAGTVGIGEVGGKMLSSLVGGGKAVTTMEAAATGGTNVVENVVVHGNSLKSMKPTWGYKLYSNDGKFLKNGITSKLVPETRYTKSFMSNKYMEKFPFPNRRAAWDWEFQQNQILQGPLNKNMH